MTGGTAEPSARMSNSLRFLDTWRSLGKWWSFNVLMSPRNDTCHNSLERSVGRNKLAKLQLCAAWLCGLE